MAGPADRYIFAAESGGDPFARNPRSSAGGAGQFIDSTWLAMLRKHRPDLAALPRDQQLQLKFDKNLSRTMTDAYAAENQSFLKSRGVPVNDGNTYLAHFAGPAGAAAIHANPGATVEALLGPSAVAANPFLRGKTGQDVINWAARKASPGQHMAKSLRQRYGSSAPAGDVAAPATPVATPASGGLGRLKTALGGKGYNADALADSEKLITDAQGIAKSSPNWLGALGATALASYGGYARDTERGRKKTDEAKTIEALGGGTAPPAIKALLDSTNPEHRAAGIEAMLKLATAKPTNKWQPTADGSLIVNETTGETRKTGVERRDQNAPGDVKTYEYDMAQREENGEKRIPFHEWVKTHKPGSSDLGAELGARIGVADGFQKKVKKLRERIGKIDWADRANLVAGRGEAQAIWRDIEDGREAYVRLQTGAGMSESEAKNAVARFQIQSDDQISTMLDKVDGLSAVLSDARRGAIEAKTGAMARKYTAENDPAVIARQKAAADELEARKTLPPPAPNPNQPALVPTQKIDPATGKAMVPPPVNPATEPMPVADPATAPVEPQPDMPIDELTGQPTQTLAAQPSPPMPPPAEGFTGNPALKGLSTEELLAIATGAK